MQRMPGHHRIAMPSVDFSTVRMFPGERLIRTAREWAALLGSLMPGNKEDWAVVIERRRIGSVERYEARVAITWPAPNVAQVGWDDDHPVDSLNGAFLELARRLDLGCPLRGPCVQALPGLRPISKTDGTRTRQRTCDIVN